jgi:hypothetical protein
LIYFLVKNSGKRHFQIAINLKGNKSNIKVLQNCTALGVKGQESGLQKPDP